MENNIELRQLKEIVEDTISSAYIYTTNAIPLIGRLADSFYGQPNSDALSQLADLFEGIQWIIESLTEIDSIRNLNEIVKDYSAWNEYVQAVSKLKEILPEVEGSLENRDNVLLADMMSYEIVPVFENMKEKLEILKPEAEIQDVN